MITLEVYASIIAGHVIAFGGVTRLFARVGLRSTTSREVLSALAVWSASQVVGAALYLILSTPDLAAGSRSRCLAVGRRGRRTSR